MTSRTQWGFEDVIILGPDGQPHGWVDDFNRAIGEACARVQPNPLMWARGLTTDDEREQAIGIAVKAIGGHRWRIHSGRLEIIFPGWTYELLPPVESEEQ